MKDVGLRMTGKKELKQGRYFLILAQSVTETNNSTVCKLTNVWLQSLHLYI